MSRPARSVTDRTISAICRTLLSCRSKVLTSLWSVSVCLSSRRTCETDLTNLACLVVSSRRVLSVVSNVLWSSADAVRLAETTILVPSMTCPVVLSRDRIPLVSRPIENVMFVVDKVPRSAAQERLWASLVTVSSPLIGAELISVWSCKCGN